MVSIVLTPDVITMIYSEMTTAQSARLPTIRKFTDRPQNQMQFRHVHKVRKIFCVNKVRPKFASPIQTSIVAINSCALMLMLQQNAQKALITVLNIST